MEKLSRRFGVVPYLLVGIPLFLLGLLASQQIIDNFWPIDVERLDLVRLVALDQADGTTLLGGANLEIVFAFLGSVWVMATGLSLPLAYFLNKRFGQNPKTNFIVVFRQAMWVGIWVAFCTWLQMNRSLNLGVALLVGAVLVIIEILLQVRNKAAVLAG